MNSQVALDLLPDIQGMNRFPDLVLAQTPIAHAINPRTLLQIQGAPVLARATHLTKSTKPSMPLIANQMNWQNYARKGELSSSTSYSRKRYQVMSTSLTTQIFENGHSMTLLAYPRLSSRNRELHALKSLMHFAGTRSMTWLIVLRDERLFATDGSSTSNLTVERKPG